MLFSMLRCKDQETARIEHDGSIFQIIDVEREKHIATLFSIGEKTPTNTFNAVIKNNEGDEKNLLIMKSQRLIVD